MARGDHILVIEDELLGREMLVRRLQEHGFRVSEASSAAEGREAVIQSLPDLILLDIVLGDQDGLSLLSELRRRWNADLLPIILVTAKIESDDVVKGLQAGANDYVIKPINLPVLLARIGVHLRLKHSAAELESRVLKRTAELESANAALRQEIAERTRVEAELRESEQRYQTLAEESPVGIFHADESGRWLYVNRQWCDMAGLEQATALSTDWRGLIHPDDRERVQEQWQNALRTHCNFESEYRFLRPDGTEHWVIGRILMDDPTRIAERGVVGTVTDITDIKRRERENRERQRDLIQAEKMVSLGTLVAGVAHEINNPSHIVMSSATSLQQFWQDILPVLEECYKSGNHFTAGGLDFHQVREYTPRLLDALVQSADRIAHIVRELRAYSRDNSPDLTEPVHVNAVVESGITLLGKLVNKSTQHFQILYGEGLPPVRGNYRRLEQVIINLVQNACQALTTPKQAITIETRYVPDDQTVIIEVADEGAGIPEENLSRITDPFFTTKRDNGGSGLGLSIAASIVQEHRGRLTFESAPNEGTRVRVVLPAGAPKSHDAADALTR